MHVGIVRVLSEYTVRIEETARVSIALSPHMGHIDTIGWFDSPRGPRGRGDALHRMQWVTQGPSLRQIAMSSGTPTHAARVRCSKSQMLGKRPRACNRIMYHVGFSSPVLVSCSLSSSERLPSRAERRQKPKSAPDDEPCGSAGPHVTCGIP